MMAHHSASAEIEAYVADKAREEGQKSNDSAQAQARANSRRGR